MNPWTAVQREPIAAATLAVILSWLLARYLLDFDSDASSAIALVILAVGQFVARSLTVPRVEHEQVLEELTKPVVKE